MKRRDILRASGIGLSLPLLEAFGKQGGNPPKRALFICNTLGFHSPVFFPAKPGLNYELSDYLSRLKSHRNDFTVFSGLSHPDQGGEHACEMTWLSAARNPGRHGFKNSISIDQYAAEQLGNVTRFPSIALSSDSQRSQSYTNSGVMIPALDRPSRVFSRLFLQGKPNEVAREKQRLSDGKSILDALGDQRRQVIQNATPGDRERLDAYFEALRETEKQLAEAGAWLDRPKPKVDMSVPDDVIDKADLIGRIKLLFQLIPLILETDSSRIISVVIQNNHGIPIVDGVSSEHHNLSHHGRDPKKIEQLKKIEIAILECFRDLLTDMKGRLEAGGHLLDHTMTLLGSNLGNAAAHDPRNNPVLLAGGGFHHNSFIAYDSQNNTPLSDLFVRILQEMAIDAGSFGTSSGVLDW